LPFAAGALLLGLIAAGPLAAQGAPPQHDHSAAPTATAVRATASISIDGRPDEEVWLTAPAVTDFTQIEPNEWAPVTERTEVRFLFDDQNLYVAAWLYDTGPLSTRLGRRDSNWPDTDSFILFVDTYHDHRTAYRFTINPSGTKRDEIITIGGGGGGGGRGGPTGTGFGDTSWDPIYDVATSVTDEGWFVEMRIPFGQLGYARGDSQLWGLQVDRRIGRKAEHASWSFTPFLERATVARFGHLEGIEGIRSASPVELMPFVASRAEFRTIPMNSAVDFANPYRSGRDYFTDAGVDLKYRVSSNFTINGTINPDFGQVEMDPAEINLSAFETRQNERRPFFVEGAEIFRFGEQGGLNTQLLYTRRIGRSPQGSLPSGIAYADVPRATTILGAVKLSGKTAGGWSVGMLQALTGEESATYVDRTNTTGQAVVEPLSNYVGLRLRRDMHQGRTSLGGVFTAVNRRLDGEPGLTNRLHSAAYTGGLDFRHDRPGRSWIFSGEVTPSIVLGSEAAIRRTQGTSARYLARPDATHLTFDPEATSLVGYGAKFDASKQSGSWRGGATFTAISPTFEVNDIGFQTNADRLALATNFGYDNPRPASGFRRWNIGGGLNSTWNYAGDVLSRDLGIGFNGQLASYHNLSMRVGRSFATWNDRLTRGGPMTRDLGQYSLNVNASTDNRMRWTFRSGAGFNRGDDGGWRYSVNGGVTGKPTEAMEVRLGPSYSRNRNLGQYVDAVTDANATDTFGRRYIFASIDQSTMSLETRLNMTFTPRLTLELYAEPFLSTGDYHSLKELAAPRTFDFREFGRDVGTIELQSNGRYRIDPDGPDGSSAAFQVPNSDFNYRSLMGNAVVRWEWRPGSTLFLVWQQARSERLTALNPGNLDQVGRIQFEKEARALFGIKPENIFMVKVNYWLNP
jgi:hypothetical protein